MIIIHSSLYLQLSRHSMIIIHPSLISSVISSHWNLHMYNLVYNNSPFCLQIQVNSSHSSSNLRLSRYTETCIWITLWERRLLFWLNRLPQISHANGFSPVCILMCFSRADWKCKSLPQNGHTLLFFSKPKLPSALCDCSPFSWSKTEIQKQIKKLLPQV